MSRHHSKAADSKGSASKVAGPKPQRCAIYTRKSTEHNLDLAFNSLDAQREACEAYIKSQAHEGWRYLSGRFDDGGLSGASLERPALQELLALVATGGVDVIVVYKVDRLTRSLADFAKLVELFDRHGVSFVSVTQSFNTTSSMGRLTLNVLLSFAQFEREVIGERVRDKIAASKRKGIWVGGPTALGYRSVDKKIVVDAAEAAIVRRIFETYVDLRSIGRLSEELAAQGIKPRNPSVARFFVGPLAHILKNRFYVGEVVYRGETHRGEHEPIVDRGLFDRAQAILAEQAVARRRRIAKSPFLLRGLLHDEAGGRMSPSHANKRGVRYRYYVSQALLQRTGEATERTGRVSAPDIERRVVDAVSAAIYIANGGYDSAALEEQPAVDSDLIARHVERVDLKADQIEIALRPNSLPSRVSSDDAPSSHADTSDLGGRPSVDRPTVTEHPADACGTDASSEPADASPAPIIIPWTRAPVARRKGVAWEPTQQRIDPVARDALLRAIAVARVWLDDLTAGHAASLADIAAREGKGERHILRFIQLACLSPKLIAAIADGAIPADVTASSLTASLPHRWSEQEKMLLRVG